MIIGITGTLGAGKGTVVEYLVEHYDFKHFSARTYLIEEIRRRDLPVNRDNMHMVGNDIRATHGPNYIIQELCRRARGHKNVVIESVRTQGELDFLREQVNFHFFAVDADPEIRYERIVERASESDDVSFEKFMEDDRKELAQTEAHKQNVRALVGQAEYVFTNNGSLGELHKQIDVAITAMEKNG